MQANRSARLGDPSHTLYLVDISSFIFRAFFAIRSLTNKKGEPTNAVYGVATMLARLLDEANPQYLAVTYDSREPSFRKDIYPEYKANRTAPPDDLVPQFARVEQLVKSLEIHSYRTAGAEADDLIATLTHRWCEASAQNRVVVVSNDKDLMQLVNERVCIWDTMADKVYTRIEVQEKLGVKPEQVRDYLALVGDSSDNIPGVAGIGPKGAADLLGKFGDLEGVIAAAKKGEIPGKKGETIVTNEKVARLSAELATVHEKLEVEIPLKELAYRFHITDAAEVFFHEMDFQSLLARWKADKKAVSEPEPEPVAVVVKKEEPAPEEDTPASSVDAVATNRFRLINTKASFEILLNALQNAPEFGFDLETTSLNPRQAEIVGISVAYDPSFGCYIPISHRGTDVPQLSLEVVLEGFIPLLRDPRRKKIGQNLKYDCSVLAAQGIEFDGIGADTMVAAYVLDPEGRHNLETLCAQHLNYAVTTYEQVCGKGKDQLPFDLVPIEQATRYSAEDAWAAFNLWHCLKSKLEQEKLMDVFARIDLPLVQVLCRMESNGVCIDGAYLRKLSEEFARELRRIEERVAAFTKGPVNLNSPKQLGVLLFEELKLPPQGKTKTGFSTDASVLETLAPLHEVPRLLLEYREISKLKGTYVDPLPQLRDAKTGKIHASFHQTVAATGRLSSSDPNLQNIPIRSLRGQKIRRAFVPSEGNLLLAADYSQIELRILAHMSGDKELVSSFKRDEDVHLRTASEIFGITPDSVDDRQRGIAKAINFGLMYGKTPFGLAQELKISRTEAQDMIKRYFERYSGVKRFLDGLVVDAKEKGFVCTAAGRKRKLPDIQSRNPMLRGNAERMAMNTPIQGTAADLMKLAMTEIDHRLRTEELRSKLIIQVHDEVVLDCPQDEIKKVQSLVCECMESAMQLDVPLRVNSAIGENWMDL